MHVDPPGMLRILSSAHSKHAGLQIHHRRSNRHTFFTRVTVVALAQGERQVLAHYSDLSVAHCPGMAKRYAEAA